MMRMTLRGVPPALGPVCRALARPGLGVCPRPGAPQRALRPLNRPLASIQTPEPAATSFSNDAAAAPAPPHIPVLLEEVLGVFKGAHIPSFFDGTLGAGGHAAAVLESHPELRVLLATDLDAAAHAIAAARLRRAGAAVSRHPNLGSLSPTAAGGGHTTVPGDLTVAAPNNGTLAAPADDPEVAIPRPGTAPSAHILHASFLAGPEALWRAGLAGSLGGGLLDLGLSSMQLDAAARGFSFGKDGPLDMRMDGAGALTAEQIVNTWSEDELGRILREYGEERSWRGIARRIVEARCRDGPLLTTSQLASVVGHPGRPSPGRKAGARKATRAKHPATQTFQAIRIAVNGELACLEAALPGLIDALAPGARLAVITFHSLEDRAVKMAFKRAAGELDPGDEEVLPAWLASARRDQAKEQAVVRMVTRRPLVPGEAEVARNPRARSAKLRVVEKL
ncbi:CMAL1 [Auxenochlorella protothecoides x Auxenochlorella symbiontica]